MTTREMGKERPLKGKKTFNGRYCCKLKINFRGENIIFTKLP